MSQEAQRSGRTVRCPGCGGPSLYAPENAWRPFCSQRCREADLGAWADEAYRLPDPAHPGPDTGGPPEA